MCILIKFTALFNVMNLTIFLGEDILAVSIH